MTSLKGTKTEKNLMAAFAGESQARNRYSYYAKQAEKEGFVQIARLFEETADQERVHAKGFFKRLEGGEVEILASFPAGTIGTTAQNLEAAANGERHEHGSLYPNFAEVAKSEGFDDIAALFRCVAVAEKLHERRFRALLDRVRNGTSQSREAPVTWVCEKCGYTFEGKEPPPKCPACGHPRNHFEQLAENW
jgi:rubrerythrin